MVFKTVINKLSHQSCFAGLFSFRATERLFEELVPFSSVPSSILPSRLWSVFIRCGSLGICPPMEFLVPLVCVSLLCVLTSSSVPLCSLCPRLMLGSVSSTPSLPQFPCLSSVCPVSRSSFPVLCSLLETAASYIRGECTPPSILSVSPIAHFPCAMSPSQFLLP